jgi:sigma-B regulation protein RsbU (phosphoserine phosphatase)
MNILIAEDDRTSHRVLETVLERAGYTVIGAWNGVEAWECLQKPDHPRMAVLDWMMPELDGIELIRKVRGSSELRSLYILLLTAKSSREEVLSGLESGADDYITKPFDREELLARVRIGQRVIGLQESLEERIVELESALSQIRTLQGLIPICAACKKVRNDQGYWQQVEDYILEHSDAAFSHALCPDCLKVHYPEYEQIKAKQGKTKK